VSNPWAAWLRTHGTVSYTLSRKQGWDRFVHAAPRRSFDVLSRTDMAQLSAEELEDYNEARLVWNANLPTVRTQQLTAAYSIIDQVMASNRRDAASLRGSVVIDALPGLGKTTIATRYAREFHLRQYRRDGPETTSGHQRLPVAFIPLSAGMTLKNLNQKLLEFYGHPAASRTSRAQLGSLAVDCVLSCETRLIVIDDLHFINFRHRNGSEVSNHLKWLANEMPVTFIFVGVGLEERKFFDEGLLGEDAIYAQTSRRATRCLVVPFTIRSTSGFRAWVDLLKTLEAHIKLADARPGMLTDLAKPIYLRTQGNIASLTNLLDRACYQAITSGVETINADLIKHATIDNAAQRSPRTA
jgi:hypothetical protein